MSTVLIADSSAPRRRAAQFLFESLGFDVAGAREGIEALDLVQGMAPDLLIADSHLPGFEGTALVDAVRNLAAGAPPCIFFVAENSSQASLRAALAAGGDAFLLKPFDSGPPAF